MEKDKFTRYPSKSAEKGNEPTSGYVYIYVYRTYCVHYLNLPFTWRPTLYVKLKDNAVVSWELCEDRPIPFSLSDWKRSGFLRRNDMVESMMRYAATHFLTIDDVVDGLGQPSVVDDEDTTRYTVADLHSFDPRAVYFRFDKSTRKVTEISLR